MMKIGEVIRKYRKQKDLTQEELASRLGVTAPAVNKWENGNTMPDITLLAPIARLLDVSLDELLSFQSDLTPQEVRNLVQKAEEKFSSEPYDDVFLWAKEQIQAYPNCEDLIFALAAQLDGHQWMQELPENKAQSEFIISCYERLLSSGDESMRTTTANFLYQYYLNRKQYEKAGEYLSFFSIQNPERKRKQADLYRLTGDLDKACQTYEEILLADYQILSATFHSFLGMQLKAKNLEKARYYADKCKALERLFEMGEYSTYVVDLELVQLEQDRDKTLICVQGMLRHLDSICTFPQSPLYSHMTFKPIDPTFLETAQKSLLDCLRTDDSFSYMQDDPRWIALLAEYP